MVTNGSGNNGPAKFAAGEKTKPVGATASFTEKDLSKMDASPRAAFGGETVAALAISTDGQSIVSLKGYAEAKASMDKGTLFKQDQAGTPAAEFKPATPQ